MPTSSSTPKFDLSALPTSFRDLKAYTPLVGKAAFAQDWTNSPLTLDEIAERYPDATGAGLIHQYAGTVAFDIDDLEWCRKHLKTKLDIDLDSLLDPAKHCLFYSPKQNSAKVIMVAPEGEALEYVKMLDGDADTGVATRFELRLGKQQDVAPGSAYPKGGFYRHDGLQSPQPVPPDLLHVWKALAAEMKRAEARQSGPANLNLTGPDRRQSVIYVYNMTHSLDSVMSRAGYMERSRKWLSPNSSSGEAGVILFKSHTHPWDLCYSHHASDATLHGRAVDAFEMAANYTYPGDDEAKSKFAKDQMKLLKAIDVETGKVLDMSVAEWNEAQIEYAEPMVEKPSEETDKFSRQEWAPGFAGELQQAIYAQMHHPNKQIAIVAGLNLLAAIAGRKDEHRGTPIDIKHVLIAVQGVGKNTVLDAMRTILTQASQSQPSNNILPPDLFMRACGFNGSYGVKAMLKAYVASPSMAIVIPEAGIAGKSLAGDSASVRSFEMQNSVIGHNHAFTTKSLADNFPTLYRGGYGRVEESNPHDYATNFTPQSVTSGEEARKLYAFINHAADEFQEDGPTGLYSEGILLQICTLVREMWRDESTELTPDAEETSSTQPAKVKGPILKPVAYSSVHRYAFSKEAKELNTQLRREEHAIRAAATPEEAQSIHWALQVRRLQKADVLALLMASTEYKLGRIDAPRISRECYQWAIDYVDECHRVLRANSMMYESPLTEVIDAIQRSCETALTKNPQSYFNMHSRQERKAQVISHSFLIKNFSTIKTAASKVPRVESGLTNDSAAINEAYREGEALGLWEVMDKNTSPEYYRKHGILVSKRVQLRYLRAVEQICGGES